MTRNTGITHFTLLTHVPKNMSSALHIHIPMHCYYSVYIDSSLVHINLINKKMFVSTYIYHSFTVQVLTTNITGWLSYVKFYKAPQVILT